MVRRAPWPPFELGRDQGVLDAACLDWMMFGLSLHITGLSRIDGDGSEKPANAADGSVRAGMQARA